MVHLIDKDSLVVEIKRIERETNYEPFTDEVLGKRCTCRSLLSFIDTLEVKEVDMEKEINKYISDNFFGSQTMGFFANRTKEEPNDQDIVLCAKHFFKLGMQVSSKTQKGEKV